MASGEPANLLILDCDVNTVGEALEETINDYLAIREANRLKVKNSFWNRCKEGAIFAINIVLSVLAAMSAQFFWEQNNVNYRLMLAVAWPIATAILRYLFSEDMPGIARTGGNFANWPNFLIRIIVALKTVYFHLMFVGDLAIYSTIFYFIPEMCRGHHIGVEFAIASHVLFAIWFVFFTGFLPTGLASPTEPALPIASISCIVLKLGSLASIKFIAPFVKSGFQNLLARFPILQNCLPAFLTLPKQFLAPPSLNNDHLSSIKNFGTPGSNWILVCMAVTMVSVIYFGLKAAEWAVRHLIPLTKFLIVKLLKRWQRKNCDQTQGDQNNTGPIADPKLNNTNDDDNKELPKPEGEDPAVVKPNGDAKKSDPTPDPVPNKLTPDKEQFDDKISPVKDEVPAFKGGAVEMDHSDDNAAYPGRSQDEESLELGTDRLETPNFISN